MAKATVGSGRLILAAIFAIFVYGMIAAMLGTILPSFRFNPEDSGKVAMAQAFGLVLASLIAGPIADNKGKKVVLVVGLGLIAAALFLLSGADPDVGQVSMFLFILGFGGGMLVTSANALVSDINEEKRASTLNFLNLFFGLGGLATPFVAANLLGGVAEQIARVAAILTLAVFVLHIVTPMPGPTGTRGFKMAEVGQVLGRPALWMLSLFLFLYVACEVGVWNWLAKYLISRGIPENNALNILSLGFALGLLIGRVVISRVLIRVPAPTVTLGAAAAMALTTWLMLQTGDPTIAAIAVFCAGLAMAPVFPTTLAMVGDAFPVATATAMGIVITFGWIGLAVSSPLIGGIAGGDDTRLGTALLLLPAFSVLMVLVNLALRPMLRTRR
ncbi:MAG TPA: MFS transporter [Bryobacteraceae bacterium]|nr:MFS transporter [Bryobacteraceae bacterium]